MKIIDVTTENADDTGFFCLMSRRDSTGWQRKRRWLDARFAEGLLIKMLDLDEGGRGFIEYIPGDFAWRPVEAAGWIFIHCLWVVGKSKGKGFATMLLEECLSDARHRGAKGVVMVTSEGNWLAGRKLLLRHGFEVVDRAPPAYELLVRMFEDAPPPSFTGNWDTKARRFGRGLTIVRTDQCPYLDDAVTSALEAASERGLSTRVLELTSARAVRDEAPSPYGVFSIVLDGRVLSHHPQSSKKLLQLFDDSI